jgi:hypothetical protein
MSFVNRDRPLRCRGQKADVEGSVTRSCPCAATRRSPPAIAVGFAVIAWSPLDAAVRPPKLQYQISTLPNGLRVILSEDHSTPIVHVSVWYHVGSKNERAGHTGFAHLFEHMMFKGSKNVEPDSHTSIIASVGGRSNAYTTEDETGVLADPAGALPAARVVARSGPHGDAAPGR